MSACFIKKIKLEEKQMESMLIRELNSIKPRIPINTYRTIIGQIRTGDLGGATVGINRLKSKLSREEAYENSRSK